MTAPRTASWWEHARQLLADSAPVTPQLLVAALAHAAETAPAYAHHMPDLTARISNAGLPNGSCVHVGWAVRQLREPDGYLLSPVQQALLVCFGGLSLVFEVDRHSDQFRPAPAPAPLPPPAAAPPAPVPSPQAAGNMPDEPLQEAAEELDAPGEVAGDVDADDGASLPPKRLHAAGTCACHLREGLASLDSICLQTACRVRALTLQSPPSRARGALRTALRAGLRLAVHPTCPEDEVRGWKLFMLAPRMLLLTVPPAKLACHRLSLTEASKLSEPDAGVTFGRSCRCP
ncbi:unnamed protein product [Symbiodinium sp. CCMP2456]|nr:unnamed protein product [Symbiodinium sp. CCMP2456]